MAIRTGRTGHASQSAAPQDDTGATWAGRTDDRRPSLLTNARGLLRTPGTGHAQRWFFSGIWLVYLIEPVAGLFGHQHGVLWIAGGLAITIAFSAIYVTTICNSGSWPRQALWGLAVIVVLAALACVVYGKAWTPLWIYVSAAAGMVLAAPAYGRRTAVQGVLAVGACYVFFSWLSHDDPADFLIVLLPVLLVGFAMIGFRMQIQLTSELEQARGTVAKLATNEERLRLARDMHDLTGQSLSMITLKSELAAKRLSKLPPRPNSTRFSATSATSAGSAARRCTISGRRSAVTAARRSPSRRSRPGTRWRRPASGSTMIPG